MLRQRSSVANDMSISAWLRGMLEDGTYRSTYDMADAFATSEPNIVRWIKEQVRPSIPSCIKMSEATGTPLEEVVLMAGLESGEAA